MLKIYRKIRDRLRKALLACTLDDLLDVFAGLIFIPLALFWAGFSVNIFRYGVYGEPISEGEAIIAVAICAGIWGLFTKGYFKKNETPRETPGISIGMGFYLFFWLAIELTRWLQQ